VASVGGVDIWKEGDKYETYDGMVPLEEFDSLEAAKRKYETYDGMVPLEEFDSLEAAKRAARGYGDSGIPL